MNYESKDDEANMKRRRILELYGETPKQDRFTFVKSYHFAGDKIHWRDFVVKQSMIPERVIDMLRARDLDRQGMAGEDVRTKELMAAEAVRAKERELEAKERELEAKRLDYERLRMADEDLPTKEITAAHHRERTAMIEADSRSRCEEIFKDFKHEHYKTMISNHKMEVERPVKERERMLQEEVRLKHRLAAIWPHPNPPGTWYEGAPYSIALGTEVRHYEFPYKSDWWKFI
jgi:hypothetical protein